MKVGRLPDGPFTLDQLLTFETSSQWQYNQNEFRTITILLDEDMPALLQVVVESHDIPEWIEAERLDYYLGLPEGKFSVENMLPEVIEERIFSYFEKTESGNLVLLWKRGMVLGDYFRVATFALQVPNDKWDTPEVTLLKHMLLDRITTLTFAAEVMRTDRIAPTPMLKQTSVSPVLRFRVPAEWARGTLEEWTTYDSGDPKLGVFEAKFNWFPIRGKPDRAIRERLLSLLDSDHPGVAMASDWLVFRGVDRDLNPPELTIVFRRLFFRGEWDILDVWFCYRVDATHAEDPDVLDLITLFDREVRQAVIAFPEPDEGAEAGASV